MSPKHFYDDDLDNLYKDDDEDADADLNVSPDFSTGLEKSTTIAEIVAIEEQLKNIRDDEKLADSIVYDQLCFNLAIIQKVRLKLEKMKKKDWFIETANGVELNPLIIQALRISKQTIDLMNSQGLTTIGRKKLMNDSKSLNKKKVVDMLKGDDYSVESNSPKRFRRNGV